MIVNPSKSDLIKRELTQLTKQVIASLNVLSDGGRHVIDQRKNFLLVGQFDLAKRVHNMLWANCAYYLQEEV